MFISRNGTETLVRKLCFIKDEEALECCDPTIEVVTILQGQ